MSGNSHNWEDDFSHFEFDIELPKEQGASSDDMDFVLHEQDFSLSESHAEEKSATPLPTNVVHEVPTEEPLADKGESMESEEEDTSTDEPFDYTMNQIRPYHFPMSTLDMDRLWRKLTDAIEAAMSLRDKTRHMVEDHSNIKLPKGLRTTSTLLCDIADVLIATRSIIELYLSLRVRPLYQSVEDSGLKTASSNTMKIFMSHVPTMQEGLNDVEQAMSEGYDRPSANLRMRIVKAQAKMTETMAIQQAQALAQTIEAFPLEYGALRVLCLLENKGDTDVMDSVDRSMEIAGHVQVNVADAPAMLEAVRNDDQKTVDTIIAKKILS